METFSPDIGTVKATTYPDKIVTKFKMAWQAVN